MRIESHVGRGRTRLSRPDEARWPSEALAAAATGRRCWRWWPGPHPADHADAPDRPARRARRPGTAAVKPTRLGRPAALCSRKRRRAATIGAAADVASCECTAHASLPRPCAAPAPVWTLLPRLSCMLHFSHVRITRLDARARPTI